MRWRLRRKTAAVVNCLQQVVYVVRMLRVRALLPLVLKSKAPVNRLVRLLGERSQAALVPLAERQHVTQQDVDCAADLRLQSEVAAPELLDVVAGVGFQFVAEAGDVEVVERLERVVIVVETTRPLLLTSRFDQFKQLGDAARPHDTKAVAAGPLVALREFLQRQRLLEVVLHHALNSAAFGNVFQREVGDAADDVDGEVERAWREDV